MPEFNCLTNRHPVVPIPKKHNAKIHNALPKIHKSTIDPPRPIVSGIGSLTEKLSEFIDSHIQQIGKTITFPPNRDYRFFK